MKLLDGFFPFGRETGVLSMDKLFNRIASALLLIFFIFSRCSGENSGFVTRSGTHFYLNGAPFYYAGTNCYYLMVYAADGGLRGYVDEVLEDAASMGLRVVRTWAFNDGEGQWNALQTSPGVYQEYVFQGLDYVLAKANTLGIRLILPFVNNWDDYGGMNQYVAWDKTYGDGSAGSHDDFYTDEDIKGWYKNHIATVLNRVNTVNGRTYKDDPTVFAWELANEPRCSTDPDGSTLNSWISEMSAYVKSLDSNHMVTTGIEGFYNNGNPLSWMDGQGTDFIANHQVSTVDFATAHSWPDHWGWGSNYNATMSFVQRQISDAHSLIGKPFILEEFGKYRDTTPPVPSPPVPTGGSGNTATRDQFYQGYCDLIYDNLAAGFNFWILYHAAYPDYDGFGVYYPEDSSTVSIIMDAAARENSLPVELSSFTAVVQDGRVVLRWTTESEVDNLGWNVYRSERAEGGYVKINAEIIKGSGTSAMKNEYEYVDSSAEAGHTYFYYIEDIDFSGGRGRSETIMVTLPLSQVGQAGPEVPGGWKLLGSYPNPCGDGARISLLRGKDGGEIRLTIYNSLGGMVREIRSASDGRGIYWDGKDNRGNKVPNGVYFCSVEAGSRLIGTSKIVILR